MARSFYTSDFAESNSKIELWIKMLDYLQANNKFLYIKIMRSIQNNKKQKNKKHKKQKKYSNNKPIKVCLI